MAAEIENNPLFVSDGSEDCDLASVNAEGKLNINWDDCPVTEDKMKEIAHEAARKALQIKTDELKKELDNDTPIRILRRKVQDWLRS